MSGRLAGKRAVVLGVAPGNLGATLVRRFIAEGAKVAALGRRADAVKAVADESGALAFTCDLNDLPSIDKAVADAAAAMGGIDIGVNSTGWGLLKPFLETDEQDLLQMSQVQFIGPYRFFQGLVKAMKDGGSIIQISSVTATIMMDNHAAYQGTKAGMDHIIRCIANEFGVQGIRANSVASGGIADTPMSAGGLNFDAVRKLYEREIPLGRPGTSDDVADAVIWLAGDESRYITGQTIHSSGGQVLRRNPSLPEIFAAFGAGE